MTTDHSNDAASGNADANLLRTLSELPFEALQGLQELPEDFVQRLGSLPSDSLEVLARLPLSALKQLAEVPDAGLNWIASVLRRGDGGLSPEAVGRIARIVRDSPEPIEKLRHVPVETLRVLTSLPHAVLSSLLQLPPDLLRQLPMAVATAETLDEIPEDLAERMSREDGFAAEGTSDVLATLEELPGNATETLASLPAESLSTIAEIDPASLATLSELPSDVLETLTEINSGNLSTMIELPTETADTISEIDWDLLSRSAEDDADKAGVSDAVVPGALFARLSQVTSSGRILGNLLNEVRSMKELNLSASARSGFRLAENSEPGASINEHPPGAEQGAATETLAEIQAISTRGQTEMSDQQLRDDADDTDHGADAAKDLQDDSEDDGGATVNDAASLLQSASNSDDDDDDESFDQTVQVDDPSADWAEGLSAFDDDSVKGAKAAETVAGMESADFSQEFDPEGFSEDSDDASATVQSDDWADDSEEGLKTVVDADLSREAAAEVFADDGSKTMSSADDGEDDESFSETVQSDEGWSAEGISALEGDNDFESDSSQTVAIDAMGAVEAVDPASQTIVDDSRDDSFDQTVQSDEGWSAEGLSALDQSGSGHDDSFAQTVQSSEFSKAHSGADDDDSYAQTMMSDDVSQGGVTEAFGRGHDDDSSQTVALSGAGRPEEMDSYGATVQSEEFSAQGDDESFAQTVETSGLSPDQRGLMKENWGNDFDGNASPGMTMKSEARKASVAASTLVIKKRELGTRNVPEYSKSRGSLPEPSEPEYELMKVLGEGGMGIVFEARQRSIDREVAMKMLKPKTARDKEQRSKFLTEAVVTGELDHPNIVPIYDVGASPDDALFYAMKKVKGTPWLDVIKEKSLDQNLEILERVSDAVAFAHAKGVVHRDLKPENVMLGEFNEVLVMDWGLAYSTENFSESKSKSITQSTSMGGTPAYMAPEMATGPISKIGPPSDVYLLGAILFEIVTGRPPHAGKNAMKCLMAAARNQIREVDAEVVKKKDPTGQLMEIALKAMATSLKDRYATVKEFQAAIAQYQSHSESVTLTVVAAGDLVKARKSQEYDTFARARFGFEQALDLWSANGSAKDGLNETRYEYALCAQKKGDFDLGMSLLDQGIKKHLALYGELSQAKDTVAAREREIQEQMAARARLRKILTVTAVVALIAVSGFGAMAELQRREAVTARDDATRAQQLEAEQRVLAETREQEAVDARAKEAEQRILAETREKEAKEAQAKEELAKIAAVDAQKKEAVQRVLAEKREMEAKEAQAKEELAKIAALEAQKKEAVQRMLAEKREKEAKEAQAKEELAKIAAVAAQKKEEEAKLAAVEAQGKEAVQRKLAETREREAKAAQKKEEEAKLAALEAQKKEAEQRRLADIARDAAVLARKAEEQQAYVARIGLADAKIRENAFDTAVELLNACSPELRNWEWGRLLHLASESKSRFQSDAPLDAIALSPDAVLAVTAGWKGPGANAASVATIWNLQSGVAGQKLRHAGIKVNDVDWSPNGKWIATGSDDAQNGFVQIWDAVSGERRTLPADSDFFTKSHGNPVLSVKFSPDGTELLTASEDATARVWNLADGRLIASLLGHYQGIRDASYSKDGQRIVTASDDGRVIVWNRSGTQDGAGAGNVVKFTSRPPFMGHDGAVYSAEFSPDGRFVASGGYDRRVLLWDPELIDAFDFNQLKTENGNVVPASVFDSLDGHTAPVRSVRFSSDGKFIVSGSQDNTVNLWNVDSKQVDKTFRGHNGAVRSVTFSGSSDNEIVSASQDGRIRRWDVAQYEEIRVLSGTVLAGHQDGIVSVRFSPDRKRIVTASRDKSVRLWDTESGRFLSAFNEGHEFLASAAVFFDGGKKMATAAADNTVRIWDVDAGTELRVLPNAGRSAAMAVSRDGRWMLTGSGERAVQLWDLSKDSVEPVRVFNGHQGEVTAVAFSNDERQFASGDSRGRVFLWGIEQTEPLRELQGHVRRKITAIGFSSDGDRVFSASQDNTVVQSLVATGEPDMASTLKHPGGVASMAIKPGTNMLVTVANDGVVRVWDADTATQTGTLDSRRHYSAVSISADGQWALAVHTAPPSGTGGDSENHAIDLFSLGNVGESIKVSRSVPVNGRRSLWTAVFAPSSDEDLQLLMLAGSDATLVDAKSGQERLSFSPQGLFTSADFSADGRFIVTSSWDGIARIWDAEQRRSIRKLAPPQAKVASDVDSSVIKDKESLPLISSAAFSPVVGDQRVVAASQDGTATIWNGETGQMTAQLKPEVEDGRRAAMLGAVFSHDGRLILTCSEDQTARVWDSTTGRQLQALVGHEAAVLSAQFSNDGSQIITTGADNVAMIWTSAGMQIRYELTQKLEGHTAHVTSGAFAPDASRVVTGSNDGTAKVWDIVSVASNDPDNGPEVVTPVTKGKEILSLDGHTREVTSVTFSPEGAYVLTGSSDGRAILWLTDTWKAIPGELEGAAEPQTTQMSPISKVSIVAGN